MRDLATGIFGVIVEVVVLVALVVVLFRGDYARASFFMGALIYIKLYKEE